MLLGSPATQPSESPGWPTPAVDGVGSRCLRWQSIRGDVPLVDAIYFFAADSRSLTGESSSCLQRHSKDGAPRQAVVQIQAPEEAALQRDRFVAHAVGFRGDDRQLFLGSRGVRVVSPGRGVTTLQDQQRPH